MSRGSGPLLAALLILVLAALLVITAGILVLQAQPTSDMTAGDIAWTVFGLMFDPTGIPYDAGSWTYRILLLLAALCGVVFLSTFIGIITTGFAQSIEELRRGKALVAEEGHTLVLGWTEAAHVVISEIVTAAEGRERCIVLLGEEDSVLMTDALHQRLSDTGRTRIVVRSGSPMDPADLAIVAPERARSIIILQPDGEQDSDLHVVKVLLALTRNKDLRPDVVIVAAMKEPANIEVARIVGGERVHIVSSEEVVSQMITQTCIQPGLSAIYSELMDFSGAEFYTRPDARLHGRSFKDTLFAYESASVIGIKSALGEITINPPMDQVLAVGDELVVIAENDSYIQRDLLSKPSVDESKFVRHGLKETSRQHILVLGWNRRATAILTELDHYASHGSVILVVDDIDRSSELNLLSSSLSHMQASFHYGNPASRNVLEQVDAVSYSGVIVLTDIGRGGVQQADARTLMILVHLRDLAAKAGKTTNIVAEMLDERNRALGAESEMDDFIISNKVLSLLLTQISEDSSLLGVFQALFDPEGSEIYLRPVDSVVIPNNTYTFAELIEGAARQGMCAIGYRLVRNGQTILRINPSKNDTLNVMASDALVVLAEQ